MLQAGIEIWLVLRQSDILPQSYQQPQRKQSNFTHMYYFSFVYIYTLNGYWNAQLIRKAFRYVSGNQ